MTTLPHALIPTEAPMTDRARALAVWALMAGAALLVAVLAPNATAQPDEVGSLGASPVEVPGFNIDV